MVIGVGELAWVYGRGRDWARALLEEWERQDRAAGATPPRTFRHRGRLFTTRTVLSATMPPGRDPALLRRRR
jgi:hypothetical protein